MPLALFAPVSRGMESLLASELAALGAVAVRETAAGVFFDGDLALAYRACLWSRLASRVLLPLAEIPAADAATLYEGVRGIPWEDHLATDGRLAVLVTGTNAGIGNTLFGAQKVKDAVVDRFRDRTGSRPSVDLRDPDLRIDVHLAGDTASVRIDLGGEGLHRRGYRTEGGEAPLKENLAAAVLLRAGWPELAAAGRPFLDPLCGSGTLPLEAALMASDTAPGLLRPSFGFERWPGHDPALWEKLLAEARDRSRTGMERLPPIAGSDADAAALRAARHNAARAGLHDKVTFERRPLAEAIPPAGADRPGLLAANPPYGERLGSEALLRPLYEELGRVLRERFAGWRATVLTGAPELALRLGIRARRRYKLMNGAIPCTLFVLEIEPGRFMHPGGPPAPATIGPGGEMLLNRLRKNLRTLGSWARREQVDCWRLYDADLPEYAVAVDLYRTVDGESWAVIGEYEAPATIDPGKARARLAEARSAVPAALGIPPERTVLKVRRRQRDRSQYERQGEGQRFLRVREGGLLFEVNLTDYLDTGLFLDHRPTRLLIRRMAAGKRFLNLFCYTAAATVHAAAGGAASSVSVDLSNTYLDWAGRNLALNGFGSPPHRLVRHDVLRWLETERAVHDLIFLDPPTYSRSKGMERVMDIQRDHAALIQSAARLLAPGGTLLFSTNYRRFRLAGEAIENLAAEEITADSIPRDFERSPRIHRLWSIRRPEDAPGVEAGKVTDGTGRGRD